MKLTVGRSLSTGGFALPTILLVSTVMLAILMAAIGATAASRVALDSQYYNQLAQQAAESGVNRANECLSSSGYTPQWSTKASGKDLRPDTDCTGASVFGSAYVLGAASGTRIRTTYSVDAPSGSGIGSALKVTGTTQLVRASSPNTVWRSYDQVTYLQIETQQAVGCPDGFVSVPGNMSKYGTSDFCLGKYEAKNVGGRAASQAAGLPYVNISQADAVTAASLACDGCHLVSEAEWLTAAANILQVASNWSGGAVGSGSLYTGHNDSSPSGPLAASTNDTDGYNGTGNTAPSGQRRTLTLSNGQVIWDFSGNVSEWTTGTSTTGQPGQSGYAMRDWNAIGGTGSLSPNPFPSYALAAASAWTSANGLGRAHTNSTETALRGFIRGGNSGDNSNAGIFALGLDNDPGNLRSYIGFRIAR